jgi:hypothetical protein
VLTTPRTQSATALKRPEAGYAGIYLLLGEQAGEPCAYVGEGEDISARIKAHDTGKEWWTSAVLCRDWEARQLAMPAEAP